MQQDIRTPKQFIV